MVAAMSQRAPPGHVNLLGTNDICDSLMVLVYLQNTVMTSAWNRLPKVLWRWKLCPAGSRFWVLVILSLGGSMLRISCWWFWAVWASKFLGESMIGHCSLQSQKYIFIARRRLHAFEPHGVQPRLDVLTFEDFKGGGQRLNDTWHLSQEWSIKLRGHANC